MLLTFVRLLHRFCPPVIPNSQTGCLRTYWRRSIISVHVAPPSKSMPGEDIDELRVCQVVADCDATLSC